MPQLQYNMPQDALSPCETHPESLTENAGSKIRHIARVRHARPCAGHPRLEAIALEKTWMAGTSPAMTNFFDG
jgi:hypothetical protein